MLDVIGKEFSTETRKVIDILRARGVHYNFIDLDFDEEISVFMACYKIKTIPVIRCDGEFIVSCDEEQIVSFLNKKELLD